jgi:transcriptional regulator with XRE-family HTH domain
MTAVPTQPRKLSEQAAEEIRAWMGRRRVTGAMLARTLGVSTAWVSYRLSGKQPIDLNDLEAIATVLGVEVIDLLPKPPRPTRGYVHRWPHRNSPQDSQPDPTKRRPNLIHPNDPIWATPVQPMHSDAA